VGVERLTYSSFWKELVEFYLGNPRTHRGERKRGFNADAAACSGEENGFIVELVLEFVSN